MNFPPQLLQKLGKLEKNLQHVIVGKNKQIKLSLVTLLCQGHLLIEDVPGVGKTILAKTLAKSIEGTFKRIQFTPDLLPSDVTGINIFNQKTGNFDFRPGPVFTNILLGDEINRATPRTQSSLLECMSESQVTIDGDTHILEKPFFVIATQNPIEQHGTFPLPEAQLDRFLMSIQLGYPEKEEEIFILEAQKKTHPLNEINPVITSEELKSLQDLVTSISIHRDLKWYIVSIVRATRNHKDVLLGASPRASLALMRSSQALALFHEQSFVSPWMIQTLAHPVLKHRVILYPQSQMAEITTTEVIDDILGTLPVPTDLEKSTE